MNDLYHTIGLSYRLLEPQIGAAFVCSFEVQLFLAHIQLTGSCDALEVYGNNLCVSSKRF